MTETDSRPRYAPGEMVHVDATVCESGIAQVWSSEWGPSLRWAKTNTWFYRLMELDRNGNARNASGHVIRDFTADEHELDKWREAAQVKK